MTAYFCYALFLTGFVYPIAAHAVWSNNGFLSPSNPDPLGGIGVIDAAGCGPIHLCGGVTALVATLFLGPRKGRFYDDDGVPLEKPKLIRGHSVALQLLGTLILWFGWYGFNGGSALLLENSENKAHVAERTVANTTMGGALGGLSALALSAMISGRAGNLAWDLPHAMNGALAGLVSITSGCFTLGLWSSCLTGIFGGAFYILGDYLLIRFRIDDAVNVIPVHLMCGIWGLIATGLFSDPAHIEDTYGVEGRGGFFYEFGGDMASAAGSFDGILLRNQLYSILFVTGWTAGLVTPFFWALMKLGWFRVEYLAEIGGLDAAYHDENLEDSAKEELKEAIIKIKESSSGMQHKKTFAPESSKTSSDVEASNNNNNPRHHHRHRSHKHHQQQSRPEEISVN